jgi:ferredoxin
MTKSSFQIGELLIVELEHFQQLLDALWNRDFAVYGPTVKDMAIVHDEVKAVYDFPIGWTDEQEAAHYQLKKTGNGALFNYVVGPHTWKKYLFPPKVSLWEAKKEGALFEILPDKSSPPKMAFIGIRACDLSAIMIQDNIFTKGDYKDSIYLRNRKNNFILAVNCTKSGGGCFCISMGTGPKATKGFDLALTEIIDDKRHYFLFEVGSELGGEILSQVTTQAAGETEKQTVEKAINQAKNQMGRALDTRGIKELLYDNSEHPRWDDVASRCLTCGNCTMVCPTCFCSNIEDYTDLTGKLANRQRRWDSCFTLEHSYIHGGSVRSSVKARYRQWLTHKFASWIDQFGTSGCVGCGRCITWCPSGIDVTEEIKEIRRSVKVSTAV